MPGLHPGRPHVHRPHMQLLAARAARHRARALAQAIATMVMASGCGGELPAGAGDAGAVDASTGTGADGGDFDATIEAGCVFCPAGPDSSSPSCPPGAPLSCSVDPNCPSGMPTTVTGTVYDPAGRNPVANAVVFVPDHPNALPAIVQGSPSCSPCPSISDYVAATVTSSTGKFTLQGVPTGENLPLVIQAGKWRRVVSVPTVPSCAVTTLPAGAARLPRNRQEGDLPQLALLTGGCDHLGCFLRGVGVDPTEFTGPQGGGRVHVYQGVGGAGLSNGASAGPAGDCTTDACPLWSSKQSLEAYDTILLGCECDAHDETKPDASVLAMHDWLGEGGMVLAAHSQATWFRNGPADFQAAVSWTNGPSSGATGPFVFDRTFERGQNFGFWLSNVGAANASSVISLDPADVSTSVTDVAPTTLPWISDSSTVSDGGSPFSNAKLLSFPTPVGGLDAGTESVTYCGQASFTDIHAGGGHVQDADAGGSSLPGPLPAACDGSPLTAEEKALEYFLFESSSCFTTGPAKVGPPL
jgi:hypothetical protein